MSIRKLVVANGISYVEIPAAGLYLLCGSPADSVKHLLRRGIIQTTAKMASPSRTARMRFSCRTRWCRTGTCATWRNSPSCKCSTARAC